MARSLLLTSALTAALTVAGCSSTNEPPVASATPFPSAAETPEAIPTPDSTARSLEGTIVRFTGGGSSVDVTIANDNVTTRDFVSMLPLTLELEEFSGREKVSYLPASSTLTAPQAPTPKTATSSTSCPGATSASTTTPTASATPTTRSTSAPTRPPKHSCDAWRTRT